jgi:hypothetical protein
VARKPAIDGTWPAFERGCRSLGTGPSHRASSFVKFQRCAPASFFGLMTRALVGRTIWPPPVAVRSRSRLRARARKRHASPFGRKRTSGRGLPRHPLQPPQPQGSSSETRPTVHLRGYSATLPPAGTLMLRVRRRRPKRPDPYELAAALARCVCESFGEAYAHAGAGTPLRPQERVISRRCETPPDDRVRPTHDPLP